MIVYKTEIEFVLSNTILITCCTTMYFCMHILYPYRKLVDDETRDCTSGFLWINKTNFMHNNQITNSCSSAEIYKRKIETREYHTKK
jgi:hypothetical protein